MKETDLQMRASKLLHCRDVLQCIFDLNPLEIEIFRLLNRQGPMSANDIADAVGRDRSTAYRALRQLQACRLLNKQTDNMEQGGYVHIYSVVDPKGVQAEMEACLDEWYNKIHNAVERFPEELRISLESGT